MGGDERARAYVALIGDIRGSRELEDRAGAQERFRAIVADLRGDAASDAIASPFTITTGDEFQGLLTTARAAVDAAARATRAMHPHELRFGIGAGVLETPLNEEQAIGMDGPCFHRAREALDRAADDDAWVRLRGFGDLADDRLGALFDLVAAVQDDWTDRQREFANAVRQEGVQRRVADRFGVAPSTVSESLSSGHVHEAHAAEGALRDLLEDSFRTRYGRASP